ncbi:MAG: hypothetical protein J6A42_02170 [Firmicutes bacterium]|nr:hypothetical protein [Bacillota bacterium]
MTSFMDKHSDSILENALKRFRESQLYTNRFGSFSKADFEVLLFTIYLDSVEKPIRDYEVSVELGITESKARALRIKSQLLYPKNLDDQWKIELAEALRNGYYDTQAKVITITLEDPSVRNKIKYEVEKQLGTVNISLNNKQLILPVSSFLLIATITETDPKDALARLRKCVQNEQNSKDVLESPDIKHAIHAFVKNIPDYILKVSDVYGKGNMIFSALKTLIMMSNA